MLRAIGKQFRQPTGFLGRVISKMMRRGNSDGINGILARLQIKDKEKIFEIGYGPGLGIERILSKFDCSISGIDFSELMFKEASQRNKKHIDAKKLELHFGNFLRYELKSGEYDKIFCINVVYFWDNLEQPFSQIRDGLKDGGLFCFYMAHADQLNKLTFIEEDIFNKYSIDQVIDKLKLSGFRKLEYQFVKGYYIKAVK